MIQQGLILGQSQQEVSGESQLLFWGRLASGSRFRWRVTRPKICFFILRQEEETPHSALRRAIPLRNLRGQDMDVLYFRNSRALTAARKEYESKGIATFEADINANSRFLMEHRIQGAVTFESEPQWVDTDAENRWADFVDPVVTPSSFTPQLRLLSIDIECSMKGQLYSISLVGEGLAKVFMLDPNEGGTGYQACGSEEELLSGFFAEVARYDPDCIIGWNVIGFDLRWIAQKCQSLGIDFQMGVGGPSEMIPPFGKSTWLARISGRAVLDGINMVRAAFLSLEDYSLGTAANQLLGKQKLIEGAGHERAKEIDRQFLEEKDALARYNLEDSQLVYDIFQKYHLHDLAVRKAQLTGLQLDRVGGSAAAFDFLYLPRLHRKGFVADTEALPFRGEPAPGGMVLEGIPGFHAQVVVLDFKSLYPSIIRTFLVDPLAASVVLHQLEESTVFSGPVGLSFATEFALLPQLIEELWVARDQAKADGDTILSQAVKIIMNSFYGVLGSPGCRFFDPRLAGTITRCGHWVLAQAKQWIEEQGYRVLYGDTDSLFVETNQSTAEGAHQIGEGLAKGTNQFLQTVIQKEFRVRSLLTFQYEKLFTQFFLPAVRGEERGSKKRYAGLIWLPGANAPEKLHFAGMESSRSDWTPLAKAFQEQLFSVAFREQAPRRLHSLKAHCRDWVSRLYSGEFDSMMVYRKGLSKGLHEYTKSLPPHVRAAQMIPHFKGRVVRYVITEVGPEPLQRRSGAKLDYDHYLERQMAPIADMILRFFHTDFQSVRSDSEQLDLFEFS